MPKEIVLTIKSKYFNKFKSGYPLLFKEAIVNLNDLKEEGTLLMLIDEQKRFIGKGYYGKQNKGYGWILTRKEHEEIDYEFFERKIKEAIRHRKSFFADSETNAFRILNGEGDGVGGFTVDYFDGYLLLNWYSEGIYQFKNLIVELFQNLVDYKGIYEKKRFDLKGQYIDDDDFLTGERAQFPIIVKENGVHFAVYLNDGAMVGVFLDQRNVRKSIRDYHADGKTVLNTFSYTGAFSVFAALGGAAKTTSVDLANRSFNKTVEQFSLNGVDYEAHDIRVMDVFNYFNYAVRNNLKFGMVILDPPSFARSKKHRFSVAKDYKDLIKEAISITEDNGLIIASTNFAGIDMKKFKSFVDKAFSEMGGKYKIIEEHSLPNDFKTIKEFPEGDYLKVLFISKIKG
ncbi:class I SAM-dependent rRNA methyltransferase [Pseudalkalibacillus salsuginis]|uniref:class I SAM-dependent rRNA methyltransferase n=1 Tax=Pseudalkalibacillus salsuginis TaxID=2910972 RepID=UPI001F357DC9|nr:class I SAM-dependent rRNA methyltransferase [Pseudalkalibacillus salsuginis]MCF6410797.1 class I SAM-dependent rRNA methyltransferase [Pseudalkalibacillus salsuginis]